MKFVPRSEATRQFIIEATAGIFNKKGYAATSLSDLTEATKLTKGSIYGNFENKEEVALAAFEYNLSCVRDIIDRQINKEVTFKGKLLAFIKVYSEEDITLPEGGCPLQNTTVEADDTHDGLRECAQKGFLLWKNDLTAILQHGIAAKEFHSDADVEKTALTLIAIVEGAILIRRATKNEVYFIKIMASAITLIESVCVEKEP